MKIWILDHYATSMFINGKGRDHWFGKYLKDQGHAVKIFCATTSHKSGKEEMVDYIGKEQVRYDDIPYIFIKARSYNGNGYQRILNMLDYAWYVKQMVCKYAKKEGKPDIILAASVHPFTLIAGNQIAKKLEIPCICEIRDLWPETFVSLGKVKNNSLLARCLYMGEKHIYKKADSLIFTMEGWRDYFNEKNWNKIIENKRVFYINNMVDLDMFNREVIENAFEDEDLDDRNTFKVIYVGSIRMANALQLLLEAGKELKDENIKILIYGEGGDRERLEKFCRNNNLSHVKFKGYVERKRVPYILSKSDLNILNYVRASIFRFGASQNKFFEYLASGKPVLANNVYNYSLIKKYQCGIEKNIDNPKDYRDAILEIKNMDQKQYQKMCENAMTAARECDYKKRSKELEDAMKIVVKEYRKKC